MEDPSRESVNAAGHAQDDGLEWIPREIAEPPSRPRFRRLTTGERLLRRSAADFPYRAPDLDTSPPKSDISRRILEAESAVERAASAVDRSSDLVWKIVGHDRRRTDPT